MSGEREPVPAHRRPEKGSAEYALWLVSIDIAASAPMRKGATSFSANIPWSLVIRLRAALDDLGIDWASARAATDTASRQR